MRISIFVLKFTYEAPIAENTEPAWGAPFRPSKNMPRKNVDSESDDDDGNASTLTSSKGGNGSKNLRTKKIKVHLHIP